MTVKNEKYDQIAVLFVLTTHDTIIKNFATTLYKKRSNTDLYLLCGNNQLRQYKIGLINISIGMLVIVRLEHTKKRNG